MRYPPRSSSLRSFAAESGDSNQEEMPMEEVVRRPPRNSTLRSYAASGGGSSQEKEEVMRRSSISALITSEENWDQNDSWDENGDYNVNTTRSRMDLVNMYL